MAKRKKRGKHSPRITFSLLSFEASVKAELVTRIRQPIVGDLGSEWRYKQPGIKDGAVMLLTAVLSGAHAVAAVVSRLGSTHQAAAREPSTHREAKPGGER